MRGREDNAPKFHFNFFVLRVIMAKGGSFQHFNSPLFQHLKFYFFIVFKILKVKGSAERFSCHFWAGNLGSFLSPSTEFQKIDFYLFIRVMLAICVMFRCNV